MKRDAVDAAIKAAKEFIDRSKDIEWNTTKCTDGRVLHYPTNHKANAAMKRASLDLTRALADMRRP